MCSLLEERIGDGADEKRHVLDPVPDDEHERLVDPHLLRTLEIQIKSSSKKITRFVYLERGDPRDDLDACGGGADGSLLVDLDDGLVADLADPQRLVADAVELAQLVDALETQLQKGEKMPKFAIAAFFQSSWPLCLLECVILSLLLRVLKSIFLPGVGRKEFLPPSI